MSELNDGDEIDLAELFCTIWAHKGTVVSSMVVAVGVAGVYLTTLAEPVYEAVSRFELLDNSPSNPLGELGGLAALAGISAPFGGSEAETLQDRILSRPFVESIYDEAKFGLDPISNPELRQPGLRARLIGAVTGASPQPMDREDFIGAALSYLEGEFTLSVLANGIIELSVSHHDPERAAEVANIVVGAAIEGVGNRARAAAREKLAYFAEQLGDVQADLDASTRALSDYALSNDLGSQEDLARASAQLSSLRQNSARGRERQAALLSLRAVGEADFVARQFAKQFPISLEIELRRSLGWGAGVEGWTYPTTARLEEAITQIEADVAKLDRNIQNVQALASVSGEGAIALAEIRRDVEVQKAIYGAMITQFQAQSFSFGFETASGRLIDAAVVPGSPSSPKVALVGALSVVLGGFLGVALALVFGLRGGRLYTVRAFQDAAGGLKAVRLPKVFGKPISLPGSRKYRPKQLHSVAIEKILATLPASGKVLALVPTCQGPAASCIAMGAGLKLAASLGDVLIIDLGAPQVDLSGFKSTDALSEQLQARFIVSGVYWAEGRELKLSQIDVTISDAAKAYAAVIVITEPSSIGIMGAHRAVLHSDAVVVVGCAGITTREAMSAAVEIGRAHKSEHLILAAV